MIQGEPPARMDVGSFTNYYQSIRVTLHVSILETIFPVHQEPPGPGRKGHSQPEQQHGGSV